MSVAVLFLLFAGAALAFPGDLPHGVGASAQRADALLAPSRVELVGDAAAACIADPDFTAAVPALQVVPTIRWPKGGCYGGHTTPNAEIVARVAPRMHYSGAEPSCPWASPKRVGFVHVGKASGSTVQNTLMHAPVNYTHLHTLSWGQFDPTDFDLYVVSIRDPVARTISAFNYKHPIGGTFMKDVDPASIDVAAQTQLISNALPKIAPFLACFSALPGGLNAWAEALSEDSACGRAARNYAYDSEVIVGHAVTVPGVGDVDASPNRHVTLNHLWYLSNQFLAYQRNESVVARVREGDARVVLVRTEDLDADMARMWDFLCVPEHQRPQTIRANDGDFPRHNDTFLSDLGRANLEALNWGDHSVLDQLEPFDGLPAVPRSTATR